MTDNQPHPSSPHRAGLADYLELVRLPNLFTAMADVAMGLMFVQAISGLDDPWLLRLALLMVASSMLYAGGVVLNDLWDLDVDRQQRPERPLPSGRISPQAASRLAWGLLLSGIVTACLVAFMVDHAKPAVVVCALTVCIVAYDTWLKRTPLGPLAMGACRMLNVLLGMSVLAGPWQTCHWLAAAAIGTYITGVTWFARSESGQSKRLTLTLATAVILAGIGLLAMLPSYTLDIGPLLQQQPENWYLLVGVLGAVIGWRCLRAVGDPTAPRVQMTVKHCILSLVMLDTVACFVVRDVIPATMILLLLIPAVYAGRWIKST
jgi:4-hydroxybenzoate polyprenyltransferase